MPSRWRPARTRPSALALLAVVIASLVGPASVTAVTQSWSITTDVSSVPTGVATDVVVTVRNTSSDNGGSKSIGCVHIAIPAAFVVVSASVTSVTTGLPWSVSTTPSTGTLVQAIAPDDHNRLNGSPDDDVLVLTLQVAGLVEGTYSWTADEFEKMDCKQSLDQRVLLPMAIGVAGNSAPVAYGDEATVHHTGTVDVAAPGLLANDVDPEGGALTALLNTPPASGSATVDPDGSWTYDPGAGFVGLDEFTYRVSDGSAVSAPATVVVHVTDDAPTPSDDTYTAAKNVTLTAAGAAGVLANDSDPDGDPLSVALETPPANGAVALEADGSFQYTPAEGWVGVETFTYRASDGARTAVATVTVDVRNSAPAPGDDAYAASRNGALVVPAATGLLANDVDENGDPLAATLETTPTHGVVEVAIDGSFTYTPAPGYTGADGFTYRASDGDAATLAAVTLTVTNGAPAAAADTASVVHDRVLGVAAPGVLANDADPNGDPLAASLGTPPVHGTVTLASDGGYVYVPHDGYVGGDAFTYTATDGGGGSSTATVTIEVTNAAPVTEDEVHAVQKNLGLTVPAPGVLANDADPDGDELQASLAVAPGHGVAVVGTDGAWTYTPDQGFVGTDSFAYEVTDGFVGTLGTVTLIVSNDGPATANDAWAGWRNGSITVAAPGVLGNDGDPNGDPLTATVAAAPGHGTVTMGADGSFVYTPDAGFAGSDAFSYDATDGAMASRATVQLDVVNRAPVAAADRYAVLHDRPLTVAAGDGLLGNDADADGDSLVVALTSLPRHGSLALQPDGAFAYEPHPAYTGTDAFTYTVSDGLASHAAVVEILVENRAPVPGADRYTVEAGATLQMNGPGVLANDEDGDGDPLIVSAVYAAAHGNVQMSADGGFTYTPQQGFTGTDAFAYIVSDGVTTSDGVVTIEVVAPPVVPTPPAPTPSPSAPPATPAPETPGPTPPATPSPTPPATPSPTPSAAPATEPPPSSTPDPVLESPTPVPPTTPSPGVETPTPMPSPTPSSTLEPSPSVPPVASPPPPPGGDQFAIPTGGSSGMVSLDVTLAAAALGTLGLLLWAVPGLLLSVPGILVVVAVAIQMTGGLIWMPLIRRRIAPAATRWPTAHAR